MKRARFILMALLAALLVLALAPAAFPALRAVGPVKPDTTPGPGWSAGYNGFPMWYRDGQGVTVELPNPPIGDPVNPVVPSMIFDPVDPDFAFSGQIGFGSEAMYWDAGARIPIPAGGALPVGGDALLVLAIEAAFDTGDAFDRAQITFARVRIRVDCPQAGTYTVTHPYGIKTFNVVTPGVRAINDTVDVGVNPGVFTGALNGAIGPFLKQVNPVPTPGWIGDGNALAVAPPGDPGDLGAIVTGSPAGRNFFRVVGPGVNLRTNMITVSALEFRGTPYNLARTTFSRDGVNGTNGEIFVTVPAPFTAGTAITATLPGGTPQALTRTDLQFFGRVPFTLASLPATVTITGTTNGLKQTVLTSPLVDAVLITKAEYSVQNHTLTVAAHSSDVQATLKGLGWVGATAAGQPLTAQGVDTVFAGVPTPPVSVTVNSSSGGTEIVRTVILP